MKYESRRDKRSSTNSLQYKIYTHIFPFKSHDSLVYVNGINRPLPCQPLCNQLFGFASNIKKLEKRKYLSNTKWYLYLHLFVLYVTHAQRLEYLINDKISEY